MNLVENKVIKIKDSMISSTITEIKDLLDQSRQKVALQVNQELISTI